MTRSPHRKYGAIAFAAVAAIIISFIFAAKDTLDRRSTLASQNRALVLASKAADMAACKRINKLDLLIQHQLRLTLVTTPKLAYYKQHPAELRRVLAGTRAEIQAFAPERCT